MSDSTTASAGFEVPEPIQNTPFDEPSEHWLLREGEAPERRQGRRSAGYRDRDPKSGVQGASGSRAAMSGRSCRWSNLIRARLAEWRKAGRPGVTRTTAELLAWWERQGRHPCLFFAQREAAETVIFLTEARPDFLQGIHVSLDEPSEERKAEGYAGFKRLCAKMATGSGKSTVAAMLAAWSVLNKVADRGDARFSDTVLIVCPNVTIRSRLRELDPAQGEAKASTSPAIWSRPRCCPISPKAAWSPPDRSTRSTTRRPAGWSAPTGWARSPGVTGRRLDIGGAWMNQCRGP